MSEDEIKYQVVNDTYYHAETPAEVIRILESSRTLKHRLLFTFGNVLTGEAWETCTPERGHVGRSTGSKRIPLLIRTSRSMGGEYLMDHCVLKIQESRGGRLLYQRKIT